VYLKYSYFYLGAELPTLSWSSPSIVGMEACLSAHFVSRMLHRPGHKPRIIPAIYVKPYLKGQKNDCNDAEAIAEAVLRSTPDVIPDR
jgi:transposase